MDAAALWERYQDWLYYHDELGIYVDVSRMSFDDAFVEQLTPKFEQAFGLVDELEKGAIANPDENRMVGHYWLRDADLAPSEEIKKNIVDGVESVKTFASDIHSAKITPPVEKQFTDVLSVGIGGSALGPQFVSKALADVDAPLA
ncbi:MAG: glucose-6-phosphate isomerase, partial [Cyanobacteria bacterium J06576_12]